MEKVIDDDSEDATDLTSARRTSSVFDYVESIRIENGVECENNILIFPSWEKYHQTIEKLDELVENDCDNFDSSVPVGISDDQYDALA